MGLGDRDTTEWGIQPVYHAFIPYMEYLNRWLKEDYKCSQLAKKPDEDVKLWIYGFLVALMRLLARNPELNLPTDLARLRIGSEVPDHVGNGAQERITISSLNILVPLIRNWSRASKRQQEEQGKHEKQIVFFLDEFTAKETFGQEELAFLRRTLMNVGECVIVASTDSGAMNMFKQRAATRTSRGETNPWVNLCTQLPMYVAAPEVISAISRWRNPDERKILRLCIQSRPLFAGAVEKSILEFVTGPPDGSIVKLLDEMRDKLVVEMKKKEKTCLPTGCFGYVVAFGRRSPRQ